MGVRVLIMGFDNADSGERCSLGMLTQPSEGYTSRASDGHLSCQKSRQGFGGRADWPHPFPDKHTAGRVEK
jgi:hypothetical protein